MSSTQPRQTATSAPRVVSMPQHQKIIQDIQECIRQLKDDFTETKAPINDDNQTLHRFCAKLEYLLQAHMKERYSMLGRKKDYWDYIVDCIGSNKGINDGIKYVKSLGEHKTSLGKGRAFLRFSLVHQRLPDTIQQCVQNPKTGEWFHPQSVWYQKGVTGDLINSLYDLTDVHFDLSPRGYDLDTAWPSFAKKQGGNFNWNPPSRRSSISSMASITMQDSSSLLSVPLYADNSGEVDKLAQDLETSQNVRSQLMEQVDCLQEEKMAASQSAWSTQGELHAVQEQLRDLQEQHTELQERYLKLEKRHDKMCIENTSSEKEWQAKEEGLANQLQVLLEQKKEADGQLEEVKAQLEKVKKETATITERHKDETGQLEAERTQLSVQIKSLEKEMSILSESEKKKAEQIENLESKVKANEERNNELLTKLQMSLESKESDATSQFEAANKLHEVVASLKEVELMNLKLQAANEDLTKKCENFEQNLASLENSKTELNEKLTEEIHESEELKKQLKNVASSTSSEVESLNAQLNEKAEELNVRTTEIEKLSSQISELSLKSVEMDNMVVQSYNQLNLLAGGGDELDGNHLEYDKFISDIHSLKEIISNKMKNMEEEIKQISSVKNKLENDNDKLANEKEHVLENLDDLRKAFAEFQQSQETVQRDLDLSKHETESELRQMEVEMEKKKGEVETLGDRLLDQRQQILDVLKSCNLQQDDEDSQDFSQLLSLISLHAQKLSTRVTDVEGEKSILEGKLSHLQAGEADKGTQLHNLEEQFSSLQKSLGEARELEASLRGDLSDKERLLKDERAKNCDLTQNLERKEEAFASFKEQHDEVKSDNVALRERVTSLNRDLSDVRVTMATTSEKLQTASEIKEKDNRQYEEILRMKEKEVFDKDELIKSAEKKKKDLNNQVQKLTKLKTNLEKEKANLEGDVRQVKSQLEVTESETQKLKTLFNKEQTCRQKTEEKLKVQIDETTSLKQTVEDVQAEVKSQEKKYEEMWQSQEAERKQLMTRLEEALSDTQHIQTQLKQTSDELEQACSLKERAEQEKEEVTNILKNLESSYRELKAKLNLFEVEGQEIASAKASVETEREELMSEVEKLKANLIQIEAEKTNTSSQNEQVISSLESKLEESKSQLGEFEENVMSLQTEKQTLLEQTRTAEEETDKLKQSLELLEKTMEEKESCNADLQKTVDRLGISVTQLETSLEEKSRRCDELEAVSGEQSGLQIQIESLNQEISALQFQLSAEQMQHEESLRSYTSQEDEVSEMKTKLGEQEVIVTQLEQEVTSQQAQQQEKSEKQKQELEDLSSHLATTSEENKTLKENLQKAEAELVAERDEKEKLQSELAAIAENHKEHLEEKDEEISGLKSDVKQLKKQLLKLIRDKDTLWQKTDQLAYQQKVQAKETWMDNNTAINCLKCKSEFSIWLRRHHCRSCGKIYCWKCVDNWVMTAHSSKKERVCDECFSHKQSVESETNTSILSTNSDDEADDEELLRSLRVRGSSQSTDDHSSTPESEPMGESDSSSQVLPVTPGSPNATDEHKVQKMQDQSLSTDSVAPPVGATANPEREDPFHMITDEEVTKSLTEYETDKVVTTLSPNMCSSMILSAEELEKGEINSQNEVWVKPGKTFLVPIVIDVADTELCWEFTSHPKDIVFSVTYQENDSSPCSESEELVQPCKCDSHKQAVQGTLTAKRTGLYTLMFDNTYSRMKAKKVHYSLQSRSSTLSKDRSCDLE